MIQPSLADDALLDVLRLIRTPSVGPITFFNLVRYYGNCKNALAALPELAKRGGRKTPLIAGSVEDALREIEACETFGARMVVYGAAEYPSLLLTLPDAPPLLTIKGNSTLWEKKIIAMVGARNASANGCQFAHKLAKDMGAAGFSVVSGLARGIDTYAHKGSLATGTVAVIAGGIDTIYPPENAPLYKEIFEQGAIISEQPFGNLPFAGSFPGRNRIIAGMSAGTVVVEASPKSGSLITTRFALENNREVFAVPGSPLDPRSKGCNQLIKQGATLVESAMDIIHGVEQTRTANFAENPKGIFAAPIIDEQELPEMRQKILDKLSVCAVSVDELIEQCHTTAGIVQTVTLELELAGRARRSPGNKVYLINQIEEVA